VWARGWRAATVTAEGDGGAVGSDGGDGGGDGGVVDQGPYGDEAIVAVMERGECVGLVEVGRLLEEV
jgi:hypothetical protein